MLYMADIALLFPVDNIKDIFIHITDIFSNL